MKILLSVCSSTKVRTSCRNSSIYPAGTLARYTIVHVPSVVVCVCLLTSDVCVCVHTHVKNYVSIYLYVL